jgi:hypothetical protein
MRHSDSTLFDTAGEKAWFLGSLDRSTQFDSFRHTFKSGFVFLLRGVAKLRSAGEPRDLVRYPDGSRR